jgi:hypothetical protein
MLSLCLTKRCYAFDLFSTDRTGVPPCNESQGREECPPGLNNAQPTTLSCFNYLHEI